jgi:hypothetical protein
MTFYMLIFKGEPMKEYDVTIKAVVTKTYRVEAENEEEATETAHQLFTVINDDTPEDYEQDTVSCEVADES